MGFILMWWRPTRRALSTFPTQVGFIPRHAASLLLGEGTFPTQVGFILFIASYGTRIVGTFPTQVGSISPCAESHVERRNTIL